MFDCECEAGYNGNLCETGMTYTIVLFYYINIDTLNNDTAFLLLLKVSMNVLIHFIWSTSTIVKVYYLLIKFAYISHTCNYTLYTYNTYYTRIAIYNIMSLFMLFNQHRLVAVTLPFLHHVQLFIQHILYRRYRRMFEPAMSKWRELFHAQCEYVCLRVWRRIHRKLLRNRFDARHDTF